MKEDKGYEIFTAFAICTQWGATHRARMRKSRAQRHPAGIGSSLSAELEGSKRSEQWEQLSENLLQLQYVLCIICVRLDICMLWREGSNYDLFGELRRFSQC